MAKVNSGKKRTVPVLVLLLCVGLVAMAVLPELMKPQTVTYLGRRLPVVEGVPVNRYDAACFDANDLGWRTYQQAGQKARAGIDVSVYQGEIDWPQVKQAGVDFAMIRCGYRGYATGELREDELFRINMQGALDAGLDVGVYFFSQAVTTQEAVEEAQFALDMLGEYEVTYPVVFDWETIPEDPQARTWAVDGQLVTDCAAAFCRTVEQAGYEPMVYLNLDMGYLSYRLDQLEWPLWLAEYNPTPSFYYHFDLWQYSYTGTVPGIASNVDLNLDLRGTIPNL